jgi:hypothetical protein
MCVVVVDLPEYPYPVMNEAAEIMVADGAQVGSETLAK